jgi:hypothetical protein
VRVVVCEYDRSVVNVYWDELRSVSVVVERGEKKGVGVEKRRM